MDLSSRSIDISSSQTSRRGFCLIENKAAFQDGDSLLRGAYDSRKITGAHEQKMAKWWDLLSNPYVTVMIIIIADWLQFSSLFESINSIEDS